VRFPWIKIVECESNLGYGSCNNLGVKFASENYVVIINPDTVVRNGWLEELIKPLKAYDRIITTPKILTYDGSAINTCGNINHFTGLSFTRGLGEDPESYSKEEYVSGFSGCCFAMRKEDYLSLGGFDENFFLYNEDSDLSWRSHLKGYKILFVPSSVIQHDYRLSVSPKKIYYLEVGRYMMLRKCIPYHDIAFFMPSLVTAEVLTFGYSARMGFDGIKYKLKALWDGFNVKVDMQSGDTSFLYDSLGAIIPLDQLSYHFIDKLAKIMANFIFVMNLKVVR
jgi:GT2 family glycosyltransferase